MGPPNAKCVGSYFSHLLTFCAFSLFAYRTPSPSNSYIYALWFFVPNFLYITQCRKQAVLQNNKKSIQLLYRVHTNLIWSDICLSGRSETKDKNISAGHSKRVQFCNRKQDLTNVPCTVFLCIIGWTTWIFEWIWRGLPLVKRPISVKRALTKLADWKEEKFLCPPLFILGLCWVDISFHPYCFTL